MKKIAILAIAVAATTVSFAQTSFGVKAGVQHNILTAGDEDGESRISYTGAGFHVGGIADIKFSSQFSVQPQLLLSYKGVKPGKDISFSLLNIDLPINLLYRNNSFFIGAGPNISYGISGKFKEQDEDDQDLYKDEDGVDAPFKRLDFGVNATLGYEFSGGFLVSANYTHGFANLYNEDGGKYTHRLFGFSVGYLFNHSAAKKK